MNYHMVRGEEKGSEGRAFFTNCVVRNEKVDGRRQEAMRWWGGGRRGGVGGPLYVVKHEGDGGGCGLS